MKSSFQIPTVGASAGTAGVEVWYTTNQEAATAANSYQIATVNGVNTTDVANTDFTLITWVGPAQGAPPASIMMAPRPGTMRR